MPTEYKDCEIIDVIDRFKKYVDDETRPMFVGFCVREKMARSTIYRWANRVVKGSDDLRWPELKELIEMCHDKQEYALLEGGLDNVYNPTITKLILTTNHGYTDRKEEQGNPDRPLQTETRDVDLSGMTTEELKAAQGLVEKIRGGNSE